jgi:hypothetical protein
MASYFCNNHDTTHGQIHHHARLEKEGPNDWPSLPPSNRPHRRILLAQPDVQQHDLYPSFRRIHPNAQGAHMSNFIIPA